MEPHCLSTRSASLAGRDHGVHISVRPHGQRTTVEGVGGGGWARSRRQARHARGGGGGGGCGARVAAPLTPQVAAFPHLGRTCGASCRARDLSLSVGRAWAVGGRSNRRWDRQRNGKCCRAGGIRRVVFPPAIATGTRLY